MTSPRERRQGKRRVRRNNTERWYHNFFDIIADVLWIGVDIPWYILRGIWYIVRGFGHMLLHILEGIGDIFNI